jgi:hypothetical protein
VEDIEQYLLALDKDEIGLKIIYYFFDGMSNYFQGFNHIFHSIGEMVLTGIIIFVFVVVLVYIKSLSGVRAGSPKVQVQRGKAVQVGAQNNRVAKKGNLEK